VVSELLDIVSAAESGSGHRNVETDLAMKESSLARLEAPAAKIRPPFRANDTFMRFLQTL
jgi:hypothetical protein